VNTAITAPPLVPERSFRGVGCDERCRVVAAIVVGVFGRSEILLHDPIAHQEWGALQAQMHGVVQVPRGPVVSGGVRVDVERLAVTVDGRAVHLSGSELRVLALLARRITALVTYEEVAFVVWGQGMLELGRAVWTHALNVCVCRLRRRLYPWQGLIATHIGVGYRLEALAADAAPPAYDPANHGQMVMGWARDYTACVVCGRTDVPHGGKGRCQRCRDLARHAQRRDERARRKGAR
jgi:DNA-binding winged helix-turn-helix (wHTH) protein